MTAPPGALFGRLFDDAAIFPPGNVALPVAVRAYADRRHGPVAAFVGPFVAAGARWADLRSALVDEPIELSLTMPADIATIECLLASVAAEPRVVLRSVELAAGDTAAGFAAAVAAVLPPGVVGYLEVPLGPDFDRRIEEIRAAGLRVKVRTGGLAAEAFPSVTALADALVACAQRGLALKLTAGLHNALRHTDPATGFVHHGFLNVLTATDAALTDDDASAALAETDAAFVADRIRALPPDRVLAVRRLFTSFGTCSIAEPLADLIALGLVDTDAIDGGQLDTQAAR